MTIISEVCKTDNFESYNSLKLRFTNIGSLRTNFVGQESFLELNSLDIFALWGKHGWVIWFSLFLCKGSSCFNPKGFCYLHAFVKEGLPFSRDISLKNSENSYLCFRLVLLHSVSHVFFLFRSPSVFLHGFWCNIDEILSVNPSANVFVFGDFNVRHKDWLTYSDGTDRLDELCYDFFYLKRPYSDG